MRRVGLVGALGGLALAVGSGCGPSSPDREDTRDWLVREIGLTDAQAGCVVDQVWALDDGDDDDLRGELAEENPDLDDDDEAALAEIVRTCTLAN